MSSTISRVNPLPLGYDRKLFLGWMALVALLCGEVLALSLSFDGADFDRAGWSPRLTTLCSQLLRGGSVALFAGVIFALVKRPRAMIELVDSLRGSRRSEVPWYVVCHLAFAGTFAWLTSHMIAGEQPRIPTPAGMAMWGLAGLAALLCWGGAVVPVRLWVQSGLALARPLGFGLLAGVLSLVLGLSTNHLWTSFHQTTFRAVTALLGAFSTEIVCEPAEYILATQRFVIQISQDCSGYEGIGLIWGFMGVYFLLYHRDVRFPGALLLVPIGTLLIWGANVVRIAALIALGSAGWPAIAAGGFHSQAGWLAFIGVGLGLVAASRRIHFFHKGDETTAFRATNPTAAYLAPMLAIVAASMMTGAFSDGRFDRYYPIRVVAALFVLWSFRRAYGGLRWELSWASVVAGVGVFALWMALVQPGPGGVSTIPEGLAGLPRAAAWLWLAARAFGSVVTVPIAEELAFRGYLARRLIAADFQKVPAGRFTWPSFLIASALFGALHQSWLAGTLAGMGYALALSRRGSIGDAVVAHAITNGLIAVWVLSTGAWSLWS